MSFIENADRKATNRNTVKVSRWVKLDEGKPVVVQILEDSATEYFKYWFRDSTGKWVGYASPGYESCPIASRNRTIGKGNKGYIKPRRTYCVNVLDMTPMVICPECGSVYWPQEKPATCSCDTPLKDVKPEPLNKVRILERGYRLFKQLNSLDTGEDSEGNAINSITDEEGNPLSITEYPIQIIRSGQGNETVTTPIPMLHLDAVNPEDYEDLLYELPQGMDLTNEEVLAIIEDRVPLSDIFAARNAENHKEDSDDESDKESLEDTLF